MGKKNSDDVGMPLPPHETYQWWASTEAERRALVADYAGEQIRRMNALAASLGVREEGEYKWFSVALHLAQRHIPALQIQKQRGAPTKWGLFELGVLVVEVERERERQRDCSVGAAAAQLAEKQPWKSFLQQKGGTYYGPDGAAALKKIYTKAKRSPAAEILRKSFLYHVATSTVDDWDTEVVPSILDGASAKRKK